MLQFLKMNTKLASTFLKPAGLVEFEKLKFDLHVLSNGKLSNYELFVTDDGMSMVEIDKDGKRVALPEVMDLSFEDNLIAISSVEWTCDAVDRNSESKMTVRLGSLHDEFNNIGISSTRLERSIREGFFQDPKAVVFRAIGIGYKKSVQAPDHIIRFFKETTGFENYRRFDENASASIKVKNGKISDDLINVSVTKENSESRVNTGATCKRFADDKELSDLTDRFIDRIFTFLMSWS